MANTDFAMEGKSKDDQDMEKVRELLEKIKDASNGPEFVDRRVRKPSP